MKLLTALSIPAMLICGLTACNPLDSRQSPPSTTQGYAPIYDSAGINVIKATPARSIERGGKIYVKNDTLYQVEDGKGIHVIDIRTPSNPKKLGFYSIPGAQELSIKSHYLYSNNLNDLVVVDIARVDSIKVIDRVKDAFHLYDPQRPPASGWFECPDASKGTVIGWETKTLHYPKCRY